MSDAERGFYQALNDYLADGFALAKKQGGKGRALGFVMTIFKKSQHRALPLCTEHYADA